MNGSLAPLFCALLTLPASAAPADREPVTLELEQPIQGISLLRGEAGSPAGLLVARRSRLELLDWTAAVAGKAPLLASFERKGRLLAWCVASGADQQERLYALVDGGRVQSWDGTGSQPEVLLERSRANLPDGLYHMQFVRDLNGDGRLDLVIPLVSGLALHLGGRDGFIAGPEVRHRVDISLSVGSPTDAAPSVSQVVRIPSFDIEDQNGDGHPDLIFRDQDHAQFFWSKPDGSLPTEPTFEIDLEQIRSLLPPRSRDLIDTANLLNVLESQVSHLTRDFDGDGFADLLLRRGPKVSLYRGGRDGVDRSRAVQVLKTGGNLLAAFAVDDNRDGLDDLCMLRVGDVSLGQLLLWIVAGGELTMDLFIYTQGDGLSFTRKPASRRTLSISIPSVATLISGFEERLEGLKRDFQNVPVAGDLDGDGERDDLVRLADDGNLELFSEIPIPPPEDDAAARWLEMIRRFDLEAAGRSNLDVDLIEFIDWAPLPGRQLAALLKDQEPLRVITLERGSDQDESDEVEQIVVVVDLDRDGQDDVILVHRPGPEQPLRLVFLSALLPG